MTHQQSSTSCRCRTALHTEYTNRTTVVLCVLSSLAVVSSFIPASVSDGCRLHDMGPSLRCPSNLKSRIRNSPPSRADRSRHVRNVLSEPDVNTEQRAKSSSTTSLEASSPRVKGDQSPPESKRSSRRPRKKIKVKREKTESEKRATAVRQSREAQYQELRALAEGAASVWGFESLFPATVWDDVSVYRDLYEVNDRDGSQFLRELANKEGSGGLSSSTGDASVYGNGPSRSGSAVANQLKKLQRVGNKAKIQSSQQNDSEEKKAASSQEGSSVQQPNQKQRQITNNGTANSTSADAKNVKVDPVMTRMVEDKVYGFRRSPAGDFEYDTSLMGDGAVKFRGGRRLGNSLKVNADRLNYHAKGELRHGRLEEARELYEKAIEMDPRDGRAYLGLSRIAQRRRDFAYARRCLKAGISNSFTKQEAPDGAVLGDSGANPFLLQALGCLEERVGNLAEAEALYVEAAKSRPSHAAAWVSLAQLRTRKFRQGAEAGRVCYQTAERELQRSGLPPSSYVYTAWAAMEYKKANDVRLARTLFEKALECDPKCSAAWLQLGVMEADKENWSRAQECFETVLKFDQRNSRVLQAYALMESKRPDGNSRTAIELFERALKVNPRDAGVLQAYALYVARLGDTETSRDLLKKGTEVNKRHAPVWQAWGVLETRCGEPDVARDVFQQGIWACAQSGGGQSGGRRCARLWQAWGVLEAGEREYAAARRCFGRALDADNFNVAAVTAWTQMEQDIGNIHDARMIFERVLRRFASTSDDKIAIWRAYELMEQRAGNMKESQSVYQRSIRESMSTTSEVVLPDGPDVVVQRRLDPPPDMKDLLKKSANEIEVIRWGSAASDSMDGEVWLNKGSIEGKVPPSAMNKHKTKQYKSKQPGQQVQRKNQ
mmetsp:Transcript_9961/g.22270  ORF Transcript_9961/g.22270 Transcript_9961/m.22270 type:complete len:889 (-) Transcript_9961:84-2750(-)